MNDNDFYNIPIWYISFKKNQELEKELKLIGFKNINFFEAIDGKKLNPKELLKDKIISIRTYIELKNKNRTEHFGIPSINAIGCTLSHINLWKKCIEENLKNIIIIEEDIDVHKIKNKDLDKIINIIDDPNKSFISPLYPKNIIKNEPFYGTHFCILSYNTCKILVENAIPIDVQVDAYMSYLNEIDKINIEGFNLFGQKKHFSSIQDICIKCFFPSNIYIILFLILIISLIIYYYFKYKNCAKSCSIVY
jgi:hypothetical protein